MWWEGVVDNIGLLLGGGREALKSLLDVRSNDPPMLWPWYGSLYVTAMSSLTNAEGTKAILQQLESEGYEMEDCEEWEAPV